MPTTIIYYIVSDAASPKSGPTSRGTRAQHTKFEGVDVNPGTERFTRRSSSTSCALRHLVAAPPPPSCNSATSPSFPVPVVPQTPAKGRMVAGRLAAASAALSAAATVVVTQALNNGLGLTPAMGYSSWNDCRCVFAARACTQSCFRHAVHPALPNSSSPARHLGILSSLPPPPPPLLRSSMRDNGPNGWCWNTEEHIKNTTLYMINSGLAKLGYTQVNIDEGWLKGRYPNGTIYEDLDKFPSGMKGLGDWVHAQETYPGSGEYMKYGLYSCRGTCQCGTGTYSGPGSHGYEAADTDWMVAAGADYLKVRQGTGWSNGEKWMRSEPRGLPTAPRAPPCAAPAS
jgi:hypothetical protein